MDAAPDTLLSVEGLGVAFASDGRSVLAVDGASFAVGRGRTLGLVGESGCGKSVTALAVLRLVPDPPGRIVAGRVVFAGQDLLALSGRAMRAIRGRDIAMVFQEPMTSLNPVFTIGNQIEEAILVHESGSRRAARERTIASLASVGIPGPENLLARYPHEFSGGMQQRAMIAMALACSPKLLICDEPTTALDVTIQAQILERLAGLQAEQGMSMLFITHDLSVVAEVAQEVAVMYAGALVEKSAVDDLFSDPLHPYTIGLFESLPRLDGERRRLRPIPGQVPPPGARQAGCRFQPRCSRAREECRREAPRFVEKRPGRWCACHDVG